MWKNQAIHTYHKQVVAAQTVTADLNSASVDCKDINSLAFLVAVGAFAFSGVNKIGLKLQHSDDDVTFVDVTETYEGTAPLVKELAAAADQSKSHLVEYRGGKQYARLVLDVSGTVSAPIAVVAMSIHPELKPPQ